MLKNIIRLCAIIYLLAFSYCATWNYPGDPTTGTITWNPGDVVYITSATNFNNATIIGRGTAAAPLNIYITSGQSFVINNNSSLVLEGTGLNSIIVRRNGASGVHHSIVINSTSSGRLSNVEIRESLNGLSIYSNSVVIDKVYVNQPDQYGIYCNDCSPRITRSRLTNSPGRTIYSIFFDYTTNSPAVKPAIFANYIERGSRGSFAHIAVGMPTNPATSTIFYFEGNYFSGGPTYYKYFYMTNVSFDDHPRLNASPYNGLGTALSLPFVLNASGTNGNVSSNFYVFDEDIYSVINGDLIVNNGVNLYMGVSRNVLAGNTFIGNSGLYLSGYNVNVKTGASIDCRGTALLPNTIRATGGGTGRGLWGNININNASSARFNYTTIQNGTAGLNVIATPTTLNLSNVSINYNTYGVSTNTNLTFSNLYLGGNSNAFRVTGGTPLIRNNRIYGGGTGTETAFNFTGGTFPAGNIRGNTLNNTIDVYANSSGVGTTVYLEQNYWSVNPPVTTNFSGSDVIDYEPWRNATGGNASLRPTADLVVPINGASLASQPQRLTLNVQEIGMYNDSPITYELQLDTSPAFTAPTLFTAPSQRHWTNISANVSAYPFVLGTTYYWRARARSIADGLGFGSWSPSWNFSIAKPKLMLQLTADKTNASAGEQVRYQVQFTAVTSTNISNATIVSCLPDDVYFNGNLTLTGFDSSYGPVNVMAWEDINATILVASVNVGSFTGTVNLNNSFPSWVTALNNHRVRRIDVFLSGNLDNGDTGYVRYETIVK